MNQSTQPAQLDGIIEQTTRITASAETIWALWTDAARVCEWWGVEAQVDARPGGLFRVVMDSGPVMRGEFIELDQPNRLVFTFGWEGNEVGEPLAPGSSRVEITLTPDHGDTVLQLRHTDIPATHAADHAKGWGLFVGQQLKAAAER